MAQFSYRVMLVVEKEVDLKCKVLNICSSGVGERGDGYRNGASANQGEGTKFWLFCVNVIIECPPMDVHYRSNLKHSGNVELQTWNAYKGVARIPKMLQSSPS